MDNVFAKKDGIETRFIDLITKIGMEIPDNFEDIVQSIHEEFLDKDVVSDSDIAEGFKHWCEIN